MSAVQHSLKNACTKQTIMQDPDNTGYSIEFQWEALLSCVPLKTPTSIILIKLPLSFQQPWPIAPTSKKKKNTVKYTKNNLLLPM